MLRSAWVFVALLACQGKNVALPGRDDVVPAQDPYVTLPYGELPELSLHIEAPAHVASSSFEVRFSSDALELGVLFICSLDDEEPELCASPKTFTNIAEGTHVFSVTAFVSGIPNDSASAEISVDFTPPALQDAVATAYDRITLVFDEAVSAQGARLRFRDGTPNGLDVLSASADEERLVLALSSALLPWSGYVLSGSVKDAAGNERVLDAIPLAVPSGSRLVFASKTRLLGDMTPSPAAALCAAASGRQKADCVCQAEAVSAGMRGTFAALLSTSDSDAYCRARGLFGKREQQCADPSVSAGPWVRADGTVVSQGDAFFADPSRALDGIAGGPLWHGSGALLTLANSTCNDWSDATSAALGAGEAAARGALPFVLPQDLACNIPQSVLCAQVSPVAGFAAVLAPAPPETARLLFLTDPGTGGGNLGGLAGADAICRARAGDAHLKDPARFLALLSSDQDDAICRLHGRAGKLGACSTTPFLPTGPVVSIHGQTLTEDLAHLFAPTGILEPYAGSDRGDVPALAFTGTTANGTGAKNNCLNWSDGSSGVVADAARARVAAEMVETPSGDAACDSPSAIICIQGPPAAP